MKNKFTLSMMVLTLVFGFMACSDKDEDLTGDKAKEALIGKWTFVSSTEDGENYDYEHECSSKKDYIEFQSNGTFRSIYYDDECSEEVDTGTYSVSGNKLTVKGRDEGNNTFTFKLSGNELELEVEGDSIRLKKM